MPLLNRLRIGERLALGYGAVIALMLLVLGLTLLNLSQVRKATDTMLGEQAERMALAREWRENITINSQRALAIGLSSDESLSGHFDTNMKAITARTTVLQKRFIELETTDEGKVALDKLADVRKRYLEARDTLLKARGDDAAKAKAGEVFKTTADEYIQAANVLVAYEERRNVSYGESVFSAIDLTRSSLIGIAVLTMLVSGALGLVMTRSIVRPMADLGETAHRIAGGDLSGEIRADGRSETDVLMRAVGAMQQSLRTLVSQLRDAADSIHTASQEVAVGNADLSHRTEAAASNLQTTASSMEQMTGTLRQSADVASQANQLAHAASTVARRGGDVVSEVVSTMGEINQSSQKIADIIGVIDGIAFQTNILALNAAVEAARAGEQGRGFAVVAGEVRSLAQRSASAAREIKSLIGTSVERVDAGARLVGTAGTTMAEILQSVQRVSDLIGEITTAATEQSAGLNQINQSVGELDQMTQQNAALVEESAAAAESLKDQATRLTEVVSGFRLGNERAVRA
ncbi:methyl-accepting chemotaxis protein [Ideonella sp.]|uniref:methyl-accepting chemotaxis protein n=1 Tax=Ideonella sp. TaxID=1929293 RepID=UPI003BB4A13E